VDLDALESPAVISDWQFIDPCPTEAAEPPERKVRQVLPNRVPDSGCARVAVLGRPSLDTTATPPGTSTRSNSRKPRSRSGKNNQGRTCENAPSNDASAKGTPARRLSAIRPPPDLADARSRSFSIMAGEKSMAVHAGTSPCRPRMTASRVPAATSSTRQPGGRSARSIASFGQTRQTQERPLRRTRRRRESRVQDWQEGWAKSWRDNSTQTAGSVVPALLGEGQRKNWGSGKLQPAGFPLSARRPGALIVGPMRSILAGCVAVLCACASTAPPPPRRATSGRRPRPSRRQ